MKDIEDANPSLKGALDLNFYAPLNLETSKLKSLIDEINKISNHIQEQVIKDFIFIASRIGYRKGELLKLVWDDIDIANREIYIDSSKTGEPRRTFLPSELYQYIKGMYNRASSINGRDMKNYPLFPITYRVLNLRWNKTQMDLGFIKDGKIKYHIHELRKISIRWLKEECGLDRDCIMDIFTGHKSSHLYEQVYNLKSIDAINHYKEQILSL
jgi:integrase